jgi:integrase
MAKYTAITHNFQNPLANVVLPKTEKKELHLLTESQQQQLCHTLMEENSKTSLCVLLSMYTGLRVGEVCALKWSDIDLEKSILTVNRTVQRIKTMNSACFTTISIGKPKSRSSMRQIPLPDFLADILNHFNYKNDSYVLSGSERIIEPRTMQYRFKSILKKANLPSINYHALRHMFATNCVKAGFDVKTLSELLGHCSVETTLNRYVHSSMERKAECMRLLKFAA